MANLLFQHSSQLTSLSRAQSLLIYFISSPGRERAIQRKTDTLTEKKAANGEDEKIIFLSSEVAQLKSRLVIEVDRRLLAVAAK
jgi:hypothetical protein